jgi:hypothetical protein
VASSLRIILIRNLSPKGFQQDIAGTLPAFLEDGNAKFTALHKKAPTD